MNSTMFTATISQPEPRNGSIDGLMHFIRSTFAKLGLVVNEFHTPNYQQLDAFRLVHLKFDFLLERPDHEEHRKEFRLTPWDHRNDTSTAIMERLQQFADAEAAYFALDKETRGPMTVKPLEIVHTPASERGTEKFWKVKLVRPRAPRDASRQVSVPAFR